MDRTMLRDDQWARIEQLLPGKEPRNDNLNILAVPAGALLRCRSLAGNGHAARPAPCSASRQRTHICPTYYFSAPKKSDPGRTAGDNRRFVEAVLWIMRTGSPRRDLPAALGHWHRTYVRFSRWRDKGVWALVATALRGDADMEHMFIDSTIVRAHQHSAGAQKKPAIRKSAARVAD